MLRSSHAAAAHGRRLCTPVSRGRATSPTCVMRAWWLAAVLLVCAMAPADAIDCRKAEKPLEKLICRDPEIRAADAALSAAYFKLLRSVKGGEVHDVLIASQRRWLALRDKQDLRSDAAEDEDENASTPRRMVLGQIQARLAMFDVPRVRASEPPLAPFVKNFEKSTSLAAKISGGLYAGYSTDCFFSPPGFGDGAYACPGSVTFQNDDRLCRITMDWASNHVSEYRTVARIENGKVALVAACNLTDARGEGACPDGDDEATGRWIMHPEPSQTYPTFTAGASTTPLSQVDPDADVVGSIDEPWLMRCLTEPRYPMRPAKAGDLRDKRQ